MTTLALRPSSARHILVGLALAIAARSARGQAAREVQYHNPVWSPDGRLLAFESDRDGRFAIYIVGVDGSGLRRLTPPDASDSQPGWSPDGRRLVFTSSDSGHGRLYVMDADGSNRRRITSSPDRRDFFASFSPDGKLIVLGAQDARNRANYYVDIVALDGSGRRELTDSAYVSEGPRWTTDGSRIVFSRLARLERKPGEAARAYIARVDSTRQTVSMRPDGSGQRIGRDADVDLKLVHDPAWSPDSRWMAEGKTVNGVPGIYVRELATGRERLVVGGRSG